MGDGYLVGGLVKCRGQSLSPADPFCSSVMCEAWASSDALVSADCSALDVVDRYLGGGRGP